MTDATEKLEELLNEVDLDRRETILAHVRTHFMPVTATDESGPPEGPGAGPTGN